MPEQVWSEVDDYFTENLLPTDDVMRATLETNVAENLPPIAVTPPQGKLLNLLARACGAKRILEIGTLGAYSTIWLARALKPGGHLITLEIDLHHAEVARRNLAHAGMSDRVEVRVGRAADLLDAMQGVVEPFDFVFIDADKASYDTYYELALALLRPGGLVVIDNTLWGGAVARPADSADTRALQALNAKVHRDNRVDMVLLPFSDGVTLARKR